MKKENINEQTSKENTASRNEAAIRASNSNSSLLEVGTKKKKFNFWAALMVLLTVSSVVGMGYFGYNYMELQKELKNEKEQVKNEDSAKQNANDNGSELSMDENVEGEQELCETGLTEFDEDYNQYTNCELDFSVWVPKQAISFQGDCELVQNENDNSYRPKAAEVPVVVTESDNRVYIDFEYKKELTNSRNENGRTFFDGCEQEENDLAYLEEERRTWNIIVSDVENEADLENFIQERFGDGCSAGDQEETEDGIFQVKVAGDGLPMEESQCVMNYMYKLYYVPGLNRVYTWDQGQAVKFMKNESGSEAYDQEMEQSFEILID